MNKQDRINELQEKMQEFILNESVFADDNPSWGEVEDANAEAESRWWQTDEGKELKGLTATKVIFRMYRDRIFNTETVIAFFPAMAGDMNPYRTCACYEHVGQHGIASMDYYLMNTRPASPEEYKDLMDELISIGYDNLKVMQRMTASDCKARKAQVS